MADEQTLLRIGRAARLTVLEAYPNPNQAILFTRLTIALAFRRDIELFPMAVRVMAMNEAYVRATIEAGGFLSPEQLETTHAQTGAHNVAVGFGVPPGQVTCFNGHLIAHDNVHFVDAGAAMMRRPQHKLDLPDVVVAPVDRLMDRRHMITEGLNGALLHYQRLDNTSWGRAPDWVDPERMLPLLRRGMERLESYEK
jgi:hypothetical protein